MSQAAASGTTKIALPPFADRSTADIVFRTADHVHFYTYKNILSLASPFFQGMFSISQPDEGEGQETLDGMPIVQIAEDSATFDCVLRYCYPVRDPVIIELDLLDRVLGAVIKYALDEAIELATAVLRAKIDTLPLEVYAIASRHGLSAERMLAAQTWDKVCPTKKYHQAGRFEKTGLAACYHPLMDSLPATVYYRLIHFVRGKDKGEKATAELCKAISASERSPQSVNPTSYPFDQPGADIILVSSDGVEFPIHRILIELQIASNMPFPLQSLLIGTVADGHDAIGRPFFRTRENAYVLGTLLQLCYPAKTGEGMWQWTDEKCCSLTTFEIIAAAQRYGLTSIVDVYKKRLEGVIPQLALSAYCISVLFGWYPQAHASAMFLAKHTCLPNAYSNWLNRISAKEYNHILRYWHVCEDRLIDVLGDFLAPTTPKTEWIEHWRKSIRSVKRRNVSAIVPLIEQELAQWNASNASETPNGRLPLQVIQLADRSSELQTKIDEAVASVEFRLLV